MALTADSSPPRARECFFTGEQFGWVRISDQIGKLEVKSQIGDIYSMRFGWFTRNRKGTDEKRCRLKVPFISARRLLPPPPRHARPRLTRRAMASAEGEWAEYFRTSALVYDAVECLDRIGGLDDPPGAPRLHDAEDEHVFGMALRYHAAHVAKRVAAARRETAAAARVSDGGGGARARDGVSLGRRLGYLPRQLDEIELDHGRRVAVPVDDDDDDARVVALTRHMRQLPKLELHAHLNGCVRDSTLLDRAEAVARAAEDDEAPARTEEESTAEDENDRTGANKTPKPPPKPPRKTAADVRALLAKPDGKGRPLQRCFDLFAAIHDLCTDHESLRRIAAEATMDFARDGVVYLELRTTPKCVPSRNVTKASYCAAVLDGLALGKKLADDYWRRRQHGGWRRRRGGHELVVQFVVQRIVVRIVRHLRQAHTERRPAGDAGGGCQDGEARGVSARRGRGRVRRRPLRKPCTGALEVVRTRAAPGAPPEASGDAALRGDRRDGRGGGGDDRVRARAVRALRAHVPRPRALARASPIGDSDRDLRLQQRRHRQRAARRIVRRVARVESPKASRRASARRRPSLNRMHRRSRRV